MYEVNRSLFLLIPREPFWHWLHTIGADLSAEPLAREAFQPLDLD